MDYSNASDILTFGFLWNSSLEMQERNQKALLPVINQLRQGCISFAKAGVQSTTFQPSDVCVYCGSPWTEGSFKLKILHHNRKMRKLKKKLSLDSTCSSKFKKNYFNLFTKRKDNVMAKKCSVCNKTLKIGLRKPQLDKAIDMDSPSNNDKSVTKTTRRKKKSKSKKDRFSGLVPSAVVNARLSFCSRDSAGGDTSCNNLTDSALSDITYLSDTNLENVSETNSIYCNSSKNPSSDFLQQTNINNIKKQNQRLETDKEKSSTLKDQTIKKSKKKKKKSLISDFLNFI